ncbi:MAG: T9SS type A sorting domain-containing protein [Bacteroidia bacterium]|nr:T9SS type A sorting domain-containing protein [Bacteroidia bacterium]
MIKYLSKKLVKAVAVVALAGLSGVADAQPFNWSQAGPIYNAGRSRNMIVDKNDPTGNTLYVGSASSGVFYSNDGGVNWSAVTLSGNKLNVSYIAQAADGKIYVATGEGFLRPGQKLKAQAGTGLYVINGTSLQLVAPASMVGTVINRVACSPQSAQKIALATNLGILASTDGGTTFNVLSGPPTATTCIGQDVKFDSNGLLYASAGNENSTSPAAANEFSKVYKSTDNNLTALTPITTMTSSLLQNDAYGRIELAIAPSNNSVIYACAATKYAGPAAPASATTKGLFVSYDAGATWGLILQGSPQLDPLGSGGAIASGDYAQVITVNPFNSDLLYVGSYQFYTWVRTGGPNSNPVGTWTKPSLTFNVFPQLYLAPNIHDIKLIPSGTSISRYYFVTDAGIYRSSDGLLSYQPFYKGLITGQFNSVSIERYPLSSGSSTSAAGTAITPYSGFIGGTGGNGLNYFSGNFPLVTSEVGWGNGDVYQSEFSKILPNAAYYTAGSGKLFRTTDVRTSAPTQIDLLVNAKLQTIVPYDNTAYNVTGTPFKLWENYGQTAASPDSAVFYNDTLRFSASMIGVQTLTTQTTFTFSAARPNQYALIDSIVVRTGTVVLPISGTAKDSPGFTGSDKKDINIAFVDTYTAPATGSFTPPIKAQAGPVVTASTSVVLNSTTLLDNIAVTFTAPPFLAKTTASYTGVPDAAAYYRVFCTVFYKYKAGDIVQVVDDKISTKTYTYSTTLSQPLSWDYNGSLTSYTMGAAASSSAVSNPTYVLTPGAYAPSSNPVFTVAPITTTNFSLTTYGGYTVTAKPVTYTINAIPSGTVVPTPSYVLTPGNITQTATAFVVTPTATTNYTISEIGTGTITGSTTFSTVNSSTYNLMPGNVTQATPVFTVQVTPAAATAYTLTGLSSNTLIGANTSTVVTPATVASFSTFGYFLAGVPNQNRPVKITNVTSARIAMGYGANVYVSNAPLSLNNPLSMINVSANKCLTTDAAGNKLSGASNTVAISGTVTALEWSKSGTELYYATNDPLSGNKFLYRVSYLDALLDSTAKSYSGKLHTNVFTFTNTVAPDGTKNNPRCPYRTALLGTFTNVVTGINVTNDDKAIAVTFDDATASGTKILYSTVADVRKCNFTNVALVSKNGSGLPASKIYCSLMEMSDNKKVFVGTDLGVYYTSDITAGSPSWSDANNGQLPVLQVFDLKQQVMRTWDCYNSGLIYAATNGRGIWVNKNFMNTYYVSVEELEAAKRENSLSLFPNPTNGDVFVAFNSNEGETAVINVMDINGRIVKHEMLGKLNSGEAKYTLDTKDLSSGMYIVSINSDMGTKRVAKLIVTK